MPIISNYNYDISPLEGNQVGVVPKKEPKQRGGLSWEAIASTILTIAEIGITLIPGVGPELAAGVAVAAGAGQIGISGAAGHLTASGAAIIGVSSILPVFSIARAGSQATKLFYETNVVERRLATGLELEEIFPDFISGTPKSLKQAREYIEKYRAKAFPNMTYKQSMTQTKLTELFTKSARKRMKPTYKLARDSVQTRYSQLTYEKEFLDFMDDYFRGLSKRERWFGANKILDKASRAWEKHIKSYKGEKALRSALKRTEGDVAKHFERQLAKEISETTEALGKITFDNLTSDVPAALKKVRPQFEWTPDRVKKFYDKNKHKIMRSSKIDAETMEKHIAEMIAFSKKATSEVIDSTIKMDLRISLNEKVAKKLSNSMVSNFKFRSRTIVQRIQAAGKDVNWYNKVYYSRFGSFWKGPSGSKWTQILQMVDPNDIGRFGPEFMYQGIKNYIRTNFSRAAKLAERIEREEKALVKAGGTLVSGTHIIGYRITEPATFPGGKNGVWIMFNKAASSAGGTGALHPMWYGRKTKNFGGKKPVHVFMTDVELMQLREEGMSYYINNIAVSRGGAPTQLSAEGIFSRSLILPLLPFVNIGFSRNLLSVTSNWVENISDMARGVYFSNYSDKFLRSLRRTGFSRLGRLGAQGLIRTAVGGRLGFYIAKEAQRVLGGVTTALNDQWGKKTRASFGEMFQNEMRNRYLGKAGALTSYTNKYSRMRGGYASRVKTAKLKSQFILRPASALTPNTIFNVRRDLGVKF